MNKSTRGSSDEHPIQVKQEIENENEIDYKRKLAAHVVPCTTTSTQSHQGQVNSSVQEQNEPSLSTEPIENSNSSDYINDCPTPDYLPPFFSEDEEDEDSNDNTELESGSFEKENDQRQKCPKCPDHFPNKEQLNIHMLRCHQTEKFRCVVWGCSASFKNNVQLIEDSPDIEESSPPVKKSRIDTIQSPNGQSPSPHARQTHCTQPKEVNNRLIGQDNMIGSPQAVTRQPTQVNIDSPREWRDHVSTHSIGPHRCLVKACKRSFDNANILGQHIKQAHQGIVKWHCDKCPKHYKSYGHLSIHNTQIHQLGQFLCTFPSCAFIGQCKREMYNHKSQHDPELLYTCQQSDCDYQTKYVTRFKAHQRAHLGIKPYRCKWPNCDYSSTSQDSTMKHIKRIHFNSKSSSSDDVILLGKPKDYLEVVQSLL